MKCRMYYYYVDSSALPILGYWRNLSLFKTSDMLLFHGTPAVMPTPSQTPRVTLTYRKIAVPLYPLALNRKMVTFMHDA